MTPEEQAVIEAAKAWRIPTMRYREFDNHRMLYGHRIPMTDFQNYHFAENILRNAVEALMEAEQRSR